MFGHAWVNHFGLLCCSPMANDLCYTSPQFTVCPLFTQGRNMESYRQFLDEFCTSHPVELTQSESLPFRLQVFYVYDNDLDAECLDWCHQYLALSWVESPLSSPVDRQDALYEICLVQCSALLASLIVLSLIQISEILLHIQHIWSSRIVLWCGGLHRENLIRGRLSWAVFRPKVRLDSLEISEALFRVLKGGKHLFEKSFMNVSQWRWPHWCGVKRLLRGFFVQRY